MDLDYDVWKDQSRREAVSSYSYQNTFSIILRIVFFVAIAFFPR